jgi:oligopeptide transport system ATP-binding protein
VPGEGLIFKKNRWIKAVDGVSFRIVTGETLGVVGESGCGKSTLARATLRLLPMTAGSVIWLGRNLDQLDNKTMRSVRKDMQMIFQDPLTSLDPRMTVGEILAEPLKTHYLQLKKTELRSQVQDMLTQVGLSAEHCNRYPHEFSGGQCQRIGIARAMILSPRLIVCDEPVSGLDVSIQAQIVNLLMWIQKERGVSLLVISHNLSVVRHISHRILVLYLGKVMETADRDQLYTNPRHPYTQALLAAVPIPDPDRERSRRRLVLKEDLPSPWNPPSGCLFRTRCPYATEVCRTEMPPLERVEEGHEVACYHWREMTPGGI